MLTMTADQLHGELDALLQHHGVPLRDRYGATTRELVSMALCIPGLPRDTQRAILDAEQETDS
jgi:hypothetical protein